MTYTPINNKNTKVSIGSATYSGSKVLTGVKSVSITVGPNKVDVTQMGDAAIRQLATLQQYSGSISGTLSPDELSAGTTGWGDLKTAITGGASTSWAVHVNESITANDVLFAGTAGSNGAIFSNLKIDMAHDGTVSYSVDFEGADGAAMTIT